MAYASNEDLFPVWREPRSVWERTGLTREQQRRLNLAMVAVTMLLLAGWIYATVLAIGTGGSPSMAAIQTSPRRKNFSREREWFLPALS